jgi:diacylglycerol kinase (ATP)
MNSSKPSRSGIGAEIARLRRALGYSADGMRAAAGHPAFRTEILASCVLIPLAFFVTPTGLERALLIGSVLLVLIVELLNTGIEAAIDRISAERHPLSKLAKDVGSAAVLLSIANAALMWLLIAL